MLQVWFQNRRMKRKKLNERAKRMTFRDDDVDDVTTNHQSGSSPLSSTSSICAQQHT